MNTLRSFALVLAVTSSTALAAELRVSIATADGAAIPASEGRIVARAVAGAAMSDRVAEVGGLLQLPAGVWEIRYESERWWVASQTVTIAEAPAAVLLQARPAAHLTAHVVAADGHARPELQLLLREPEGEPRGGPVTVRCRVDRHAEALCSVPAGRFDVEASVTDAMPHFIQALTFPPGKLTPLALPPFHPGAAIHGWVHFTTRGAAGTTLAPRVTLTQISEGASSMPGETLTVAAGSGGFFRFTDLRPGSYELSATTATLASDVIAQRVRPSTEATLPRALVLRPLKRVTVHLTPPRDPAGDPWLVRLDRADVLRAATVGSGLSDPKGDWTSPATRSGNYVVRVARDTDTGWAARAVELAEGDASIELDLRPVRIEGTVTLRGKALGGTVTFGTPRTFLSSRFPVDDDGRFHALLPAQESYDVRFDADEPTTHHRFPGVVPHEGVDGILAIDLAIPATAIDGTTVDGDGMPVADAHVTVGPPRPGEGAPPDSWSDAKGHFTLVGLEPGRYRIEATSAAGRSEPVDVMLAADDVSSLRLVLADDSQVRGRVVMLPSRTPVENAAVLAIATAVPMPTINAVRTDAAGAFHYRFPAGAKEGDVLLLPPGGGLKIVHVALGDAPLEIAASPVTGTLTVDVPARNGLPIGVYLVHDGAAFLLGMFLGAWPTRSSASGDGRQEIEISAVEAGHYAVCTGRESAQASRPIQRLACVDGDLAPFGELRLTLAGDR